MNVSEDKRSGLHGWIGDVSSNVVAGIVLAVLAGVGAWAFGLYPLARDWLAGSVLMFRWGLLASLGGAALVAFLAGRLWPRKGPKVGHKIVSLPVVSAAQPATYEPDRLADQVLRMLRFADGRWTSESAFAKVLQVASRQDLREALRGLVMRGWIEGHSDNSIWEEGAQSYRLSAPGIAYCRQKGYKTKIEIEREDTS